MAPRCHGTHIQYQARIEQQVRVNTLQLVHDGTDVFRAVGYFDTCSLFDTRTQRMAALVCAQVIQTVGHAQSLRISQAFVHFLDTAVDIAQNRVNLLNKFTVEGDAHT